MSLFLILLLIVIILILTIFAGFWATLFIIIIGTTIFTLVYFFLNKYFGNRQI
jgi:predicted PurR-regulated permease PerM